MGEECVSLPAFVPIFRLGLPPECGPSQRPQWGERRVVTNALADTRSNFIEHMFRSLKAFWRIAARYEKLAANYAAAAHIAAIEV